MRKCKIFQFPYEDPARELLAYIMSYKSKIPELGDIVIESEWYEDDQVIQIIYKYPTGFQEMDTLTAGMLHCKEKMEEVADDIVRDLLKYTREYND